MKLLFLLLLIPFIGCVDNKKCGVSTYWDYGSCSPNIIHFEKAIEFKGKFKDESINGVFDTTKFRLYNVKAVSSCKNCVPAY